MKIINPRIQIQEVLEYNIMKQLIERCGRTCYKSEDKITNESADKFIKMIINRKHKSVLEHVSIPVKIICDRGVSHELVRHRLASYSQESTRYCNYNDNKFNNEITLIKPLFFKEDNTDKASMTWYKAMKECEDAYFDLLKNNMTPQDARSVLPNSLKTEINMTCNIREWHTVFDQRLKLDAHPQMIQVMITIVCKFIERFPIFFEEYRENLNKCIEYFERNHYEIADAI